MARNMKTVLVHGCFDLLHAGHLAHFQKAKGLGDRLIVSVTADRFVNKGPGRPCFPQEVRANLIRALSIVDEVVISDHPTAVKVINEVRPAFFVKGPDYRDKDTPDIKAEIEAIESIGGKFVCTDDPTYSSSALANRFFVNWTEEQQRTIGQIREIGGMEAIESALKKVQDQVAAAVVGECISDVYRFVKPQGVSSKSPTISAAFEREERYQGGAWAIARHLEGFCFTRQVLTGYEHEKIRYISSDTGQRLFEVTKLADEPRLSCWDMPPHNLLLVADFGHGAISESFHSGEFKALNVQTNSSNYGFNSFKKHQHFDYLVVDLRELRLAYQDKVTSPEDLGMWAHSEHKKPVAVTLGPLGSIFYDKGQVYRCPAFCDHVVDAIGAGDAFLAITSPLVKTEANPLLIGFLGNVFAGLKSKIIGNKASVTKDSLLRTCAAILR